jgi:hypothetical protein
MPTQLWGSPGDYTFTVPAGVHKLLIDAGGCGGNGADASGGVGGGGGGGGGSFGFGLSQLLLSVSPGDAVSIHVAANSIGDNTTIVYSGVTQFTGDPGQNATGSSGGTGGVNGNPGVNRNGADGDGFSGGLGGGPNGGGGGNPPSDLGSLGGDGIVIFTWSLPVGSRGYVFG